ncbi:MAG: hypothetical protein IPJ47_16390 [Anaerolineales bacterium]|nr:hypothetical protein [Anaerolineales bacterium]
MMRLNFGLFVLISCIDQSVIATPTIKEIVAAEDINNSIIVSAPEGLNTYKIGEPVMLHVKLLTKMPVFVSEDNVHIDIYENGMWRTIKNLNADSDFKHVLFFKEIEALRSIPLRAQPDLSKGDYKTSVNLRFLVEGYFFENETKGDSVFAYIDVELFP